MKMIQNNGTIHQFAKAKLIEYWDQITPEQQTFFRRLYSHKDPEAPIQDIVNTMPVDKLDWAIHQCEASIRKNNKQ